MASNALELVISIDGGHANTAIKGINNGLSSIEQTAVRVARNASAGVDGMTHKMVEAVTVGELLAHTIERMGEMAKDFVKESILLSAQLERTQLASGLLAESLGKTPEDAKKWVESVAEIGYTARDATEFINQLLVAGNKNVEKLAPKMAEAAKALERAGLGDAPQTLDLLFRAIETGRDRGLRSIGVIVDLAGAVKQAEAKAKYFNKTLDESALVQVRADTVMKALSEKVEKLSGTAGTAQSAIGRLHLEVDKLKEKFGAEFQKNLKEVLSLSIDLVRWVGEHTRELKTFIAIIVLATSALGAYAIGAKAAAVATATLNATVALNPFGLLAAGLTVFAGILAAQYMKMRDMNDELAETVKHAKILDAIKRGDTEALKGYNKEDVRRALGGKEAIPGMEEEALKGADFPSIKVTGIPGAETKKPEKKIDWEAMLKAREAQEKVLKESRRYLEAAEESTTGDAALKVMKEQAREIERLQDQLPKGAKISAEARANIEAATAAKLLKIWLDADMKRLEADRKWAEDKKRLLEEVAQFDMEREKATYNARMKSIEAEKAHELRLLEATDAQTLPKKLAIIQKQADVEERFARERADVEIAHENRVYELKVRHFQVETDMLLAQKRLEMAASGLYKNDPGAIDKRIAELKALRDQQAGLLAEERDFAVEAAKQESGEQVRAARENAVTKQVQMVKDYYTGVFNTLKTEAGGIFDALTSKGRDTWKALADSFKTAILTAIKDVVTSRIAMMLMRMMGVDVSLERGTGTPGIGSMMGVGAVPVFGGMGGGGGTFGSGASMGGMVMSWGMPMMLGAGGGRAGTGEEMPSGIGLGNGFGFMPGGIPGSGGSAQNLGMLANLKQSLTSFGQIGKGFSVAHGGNVGALGGAELLGGGMLAMMGLERGGVSGLGMDIAGGALIGAKFGGPWGAAIGAAVGLGAGLIRLFMGTATDKVRKKIKQRYQVDISDKGVLQKILEISKQHYGGNIDMAINSAEVRDLVSLYAQSTGQPTNAIPQTKPTPIALGESGGGLYQMPGYSDGSPSGSAGGLLPTFDSLGARATGGAGGGRTVLQLDGATTERVLKGQAVEAMAQNPRAVQSASMTAMKANYNRRSSLATLLSPSTLTN